VISWVAVALTVIAAAPLAAQLPLSALAGVLLVVAYEMIRKNDIKRTIRATRSDGMVLIITFLSALLLNIAFAVYVGVLLSIGLHLAKTSHPRIYSTVPDLSTGKMVGSAYGEICCQMDIVCIEGSIFFGSAAYVLEDLQRRLRNHPHMPNLLLRMRQVNTMDASGVHTLETLLEEVREQGGSLFFSAMNPRVFDVFKNSGFLKEVGEPQVRMSTRGAIRQAMRENFCPAICATCELVVFVECPELKQGNWEIFGKDVRPRLCVLPQVEEKAPFARRTLGRRP
jgi:SulP family sulfate permease